MSLVDDIRSGSSDAIKQLYQENAQDVYDFAKGITNNHETAMQATKSTLSKLVQQIQDGSEPANIHSEALKLAYDEACKIAMPSVENIKSPYDEEEEEPVAVQTPKKPRQEPRQESRPEPRKEPEPQKAPRREEYYDDRYEEEEYEEAPRVQRRGNAGRAQNSGSRAATVPVKGNRQSSARRNPRQDYYEDDYDRDQRGGRGDRGYDRYDDYDDGYDDYYEGKPKHGAGFYVCLVINIILVLILIWFLIGLLMNLGVLPDTLQSTLGYEWFNNNIYQLF